MVTNTNPADNQEITPDLRHVYNRQTIRVPAHHLAAVAKERAAQHKDVPTIGASAAQGEGQVIANAHKRLLWVPENDGRAAKVAPQSHKHNAADNDAKVWSHFSAGPAKNAHESNVQGSPGQHVKHPLHPIGRLDLG